MRAKIAADPAAYRWSSFGGYCRAARRLTWVTCRRVLADFGPGREIKRRERYARYVRSAMDASLPAPWAGAFEGIVIGSADFLDRVKQTLQIRKMDPDVPLSRAFIDRPRLEYVVDSLAKELGASRRTWRAGRRDNGFSRALAAYVARQVYQYSGKAIAAALGYRDGGSVTRALQRIESDATLFKQAQVLSRRVGKRLK